MLTLVVFAGCENNDDTANGPVLTLAVADFPVYLYGSLENWVIVHDEQGALVDYKKFERGTDVVIDTDKPLPGNTVGVTLLRYRNDGIEQWTITSFLQIAIGSKLTLPNASAMPLGNDGAATGAFTVEVTGIDRVYESSISNSFGETCGGGWGTGGASFTCSTTAKTPKYFLLVAGQSVGDARYKMIENVKPDDSYSLSYANMSPFDKFYSFAFPSSNDVFLYTTGKEPGQTEGSGYVINYNLNGDTHTQVAAGYLNSLTDYFTLFQARYADHTYIYENRGSIPEGEIDWPSRSDFSLAKTFINDFKSTVNVPFVYRESTWRYLSPAVNPQKQIWWTVFGTTEAHTFTELPAEIVAKYPDLVFDNLKHMRTSYVSGTNSYTDLLSKELNPGETKPGILKTVTVW